MVTLSVSPAPLFLEQTSEARQWVFDTNGILPFNGRTRFVTSVVAESDLTNAAGDQVFAMPLVDLQYGPNKDQVLLTWPEPVKGRLHVTVRADRGT